MYEIEDNVPLPNHLGGTAYPFDRLEIGQSFFVPNKKLSSFTALTQYYKTKLRRKFTCRTMDGGVRVWRVACAVLFSLACLTPAHAEWYVAGDVLHNRFSCPTVDGTWKQDLITGGSACEQNSLAWDAGLGYRFQGGSSAWSQLWSVESGYRDWGSIGVGGRWVSDEHYTEVMAHGEGWLDKQGITPKSYQFEDRLHGGYLRVAKAVDIGYGLEPFMSAGIFGGTHTMGRVGYKPAFEGMVIGPTVGGGIKYELYRGVKARLSVDSHWTLGETKHPISSQWITVGGGIEMPLTGWW